MTITRRWQSGFETASLVEIDTLSWPGMIAISTTAHTGTYSLRMDHYNDGRGNIIVPATRQIRVGMYVRFDYFPSTSTGIFVAYTSGGTKLIEIEVDNMARMFIDCGGTHGTPAGALALYTWYHFGVDIKIDSSAGWVYVYKDGIELVSTTGNTGNSDIGITALGTTTNNNNYGCYFYWDNVYIDDTTGEGSAAVVPIKTFRYITPATGSPTYAQWDGSDGNSVDNYALVDEVPPNSDTDYVCTNVVDELDSYQMSTFTLDTGETIKAVIPISYVKRFGTTEQIALGTRYSSTDVVGSDQAPSTSYSYKWERQTAKPGGGSWDQAALDDVEVVIKSRGSF